MQRSSTVLYEELASLDAFFPQETFELMVNMVIWAICSRASAASVSFDVSSKGFGRYLRIAFGMGQHPATAVHPDVLFPG